MSKAFTREDDADLPPLIPPRAPLPDGVPNYVTADGLARLRAELAQLEVERRTAGRDLEGIACRHALAVLGARLAELEQRIRSAELVVPPVQGAVDEVRFGARVAVESEAGIRQYSIVGVDEADASLGKIAFVSPLARALLGRSVGDIIHLRTPRGEEILKIASVDYGAN